MTTLFRATLISLAAFAAIGAHAADTATMGVKITISKACNISTTTAGDVDFGTVASTATNVLGTAGSLTANCTKNTPYSIALGNGLNYSTTRQMKYTVGSVDNFVAYGLFRDASRTQAWGSTSGTGGNVYTASGNGADQAIPVYGQVPSANSAAGAYTDSVVATITY